MRFRTQVFKARLSHFDQNETLFVTYRLTNFRNLLAECKPCAADSTICTACQNNVTTVDPCGCKHYSCENKGVCRVNGSYYEVGLDSFFDYSNLSNFLQGNQREFMPVGAMRRLNNPDRCHKRSSCANESWNQTLHFAAAHQKLKLFLYIMLVSAWRELVDQRSLWDLHVWRLHCGRWWMPRSCLHS